MENFRKFKFFRAIFYSVVEGNKKHGLFDLGVFSTRQLANQKINKTKNLPGFKNYSQNHFLYFQHSLCAQQKPKKIE